MHTRNRIQGLPETAEDVTTTPYAQTENRTPAFCQEDRYPTTELFVQTIMTGVEPASVNTSMLAAYFSYRGVHYQYDNNRNRTYN